jgi:hypothetical protein
LLSLLIFKLRKVFFSSRVAKIRMRTIQSELGVLMKRKGRNGEEQEYLIFMPEGDSFESTLQK